MSVQQRYIARGTGDDDRMQSEMDRLLLKKTLEWEMSLDARDLRSHAWYHGGITRSKAEELLVEEYEQYANKTNHSDCDTIESTNSSLGSYFLVRDCSTQPSNYVLSCLVLKKNLGPNVSETLNIASSNFNHQVLHFVINKVVLEADSVYKRVQYRFEQDSFDTVPDLITFYVGSGQPISCGSLVRIRTPCNRKYPLTMMEVNENTSSSNDNFRVVGKSDSLFFSSSLEDILHNKFPTTTSGSARNITPPKIPAKQAVQNIQQQMRNNIRKHSLEKGSLRAGISSLVCSTNSLPRTGSGKISSRLSSISPNVSSSSSTMPRSAKIATKQNISNDKLPNHKNLSASYITASSVVSSNSNISNIYKNYPVTSTNNELPSTDGLSSQGENDGNNGTLKKQQTPINFGGGVMIKHPLPAMSGQKFSLDLSFQNDGSVKKNVYTTSDGSRTDCKSLFADLDNFQTLLLPSTLEGNKPLDGTALEGVHWMIQQTCSRVLANHITYVDLSITLFGNEKEASQGYTENIDIRAADENSMSSTDNSIKKTVLTSTSCPLELCLLPTGHRRRLDLIERNECVKFLVAVTILTCETLENRAQLLDKWIQVAIDLKTALGNLYGFSSIMSGLCDSSIQRLSDLWLALRKNYTDSAFNFEAKLRPQWLSMDRGTNPQAPNTTIPHLMPILWVHEKIHVCSTGIFESQQPHTTYNNNVNRSNEQEINGTVNSMASTLNHQLSFDENILSTSVGSLSTGNGDFGLQTLLNHMQAARSHLRALNEYRRNANTVLPAINPRECSSNKSLAPLPNSMSVDQLLLDLFSTEFLLKFLWGSKAVTSQKPPQTNDGFEDADQTPTSTDVDGRLDVAADIESDASCMWQRHEKFRAILRVMSEKCESPKTLKDRVGENVTAPLQTAV
ncbi:breast cancer anti-estrogen resistance protein 3 homolog [Adelges cooleyi]|uniref:breast cancer anti-estrogen resistance protein 3 homolog n=1 Tax=Adelges cooleyi TaxID=133065 RepID=UPI0021808A4B|nr:breast cancer anti-estrogen resistance protein 3 homolog [Adelges cooleyi]